MKCLICGEEHYSTSRSCKVWKRAKDIITIKYHESLSFAEARKIVEACQALGVSYSSVTKSNAAKAINIKDAQTQTNDASVQTDSVQQHTIISAKPQKPVVEQPEKPVRNKSKVLTNLPIRSIQIAFQRDLMTKFNNITAFRVLMRKT